MYSRRSLPKSTKEFILKVAFYSYLAVVAVLIVLATMATGCTSAKPVVSVAPAVINLPADPVIARSPAGNDDSLVDRGLGFYDGCMAASKKSDNCEKLATAYVGNLKNLVN